MALEYLAAYLADHLAGSVAAIDLLDQLEKNHTGTEVARIISSLRMDIEADQEELRNLMQRLSIEESRPRKMTAWLAAKMSALKLRAEDRARGPLRLLESAEIISLGIEGKRLLWQSLRAVAERAPALVRLDYDRLIQRAEEQRSRIEAVRLQAASEALAPTGKA